MRKAHLHFFRILLLVLVGFAPAMGDLLVTTSDGGILHATGYEREGDWARIHLQGGSVVMLPMKRVERVVDDSPADALRDLSVESLQLRFDGTYGVPPTPFGKLIFESARGEGLSPHFVAAVVRAESAFEPQAVSHKGARGLMQLMPATASRFGVSAENLFDPERNLKAGTAYLADLLERYGGDPLRTLAAYNAGEAAVDSHGGVPPFAETHDYIRRVVAFMRSN